MKRFTKWTDLNCFLSSDRRGAYLFFLLVELAWLVSKLMIIMIIVIIFFFSNLISCYIYTQIQLQTALNR